VNIDVSWILAFNGLLKTVTVLQIEFSNGKSGTYNWAVIKKN
jgi:hypothetical protein